MSEWRIVVWVVAVVVAALGSYCWGWVQGRAMGESVRSTQPETWTYDTVLVELASNVVRGIDRWNDSVQKVIGRVPDYQWGDLEALRCAIACRDIARPQAFLRGQHVTPRAK